MSEQNNGEEKIHPEFSLRKATEEDLDFLFNVSTEAMRPVVEKLNPDKEFNREEEFEKYKTKFEPDKVDVVEHNGQAIGRLRVVRSSESIYVGGIQILPEFQRRGIGGSVFRQLIEESKSSGLPIILEVHDVNADAIKFYKNLGFEEGEKKENQTIMRYMP